MLMSKMDEWGQNQWQGLKPVNVPDNFKNFFDQAWLPINFEKFCSDQDPSLSLHRTA